MENFKPTHQSPNSVNNSGGVEKNTISPEQNYKQAKEVVRNLDISKIENLQVQSFITDFAPEAKEIFEDSNNLKQALLNFSSRIGIVNKENVKEFLDNKFQFVLNDINLESAEENSYISVPSRLKNIDFHKVEEIDFDDVTVLHDESIYDLLSLEKKLTSLKQINDAYLTKEGVIYEKISEYLASNPDVEFGEIGNAQYVYPLNRPVTSDDIDNFKILFSYRGNEFEISKNIQDNTHDLYLENKDNPYELARFGAWFKCKINGEDYNEKSYSFFNNPSDVPEEELIKSSTYEGFNSWRKWIGYQDIVVDENN